MTTPNTALVNDPQAVETLQHMQLPTQLNVMVGNPAAFAGDASVQSAIINLQGEAKRSAELIGKLTQDETRTTPLKHEAASKIAAKLAGQAEATQLMVLERANEYNARAEATMEERFAPNEKRMYLYDRIAAWVATEAKNGEGNGYRNIREAIETNSDFAMVVSNFPHQLLGMPRDHLLNFRATAAQRWAPDATNDLLFADKLTELATKYPPFVKRVNASFFSPFELAKVRTRVEV